MPARQPTETMSIAISIVAEVEYAWDMEDPQFEGEPSVDFALARESDRSWQFQEFYGLYRLEHGPPVTISHSLHILRVFAVLRILKFKGKAEGSLRTRRAAHPRFFLAPEEGRTAPSS